MLTIEILRRWLCAAAIGVGLVLLAHGAHGHGYRHVASHHHGHYRHRGAHGHRRGGKGHRRHLYYSWSTSVPHLASPSGYNSRLPVVAPDLVAEARRFLGRGNFTGLHVDWCKAGLNVWLRAERYFANPSNRAIDALYLGPRLPGPAIGAIFVKRHHTGIVIGATSRGILTISANHGHRVGIGIERGIIAYIAPRRL